MFEIVLSEEVGDWVKGLDNKEVERLVAALSILQQEGPNLGRPLVDTIKGSSIHNLKELRLGSNRVLFTFSASRQALLLVAGNKKDRWESWYQVAIPRAEITLAREF